MLKSGLAYQYCEMLYLIPLYLDHELKDINSGGWNDRVGFVINSDGWEERVWFAINSVGEMIGWGCN